MNILATCSPAVASIETTVVSKTAAAKLQKSGSSLQNLPSGLSPDRFTRPQTQPVHQFPSFNSKQLDEQLRRYAEFVSNYGVPDILIVGSSRSYQGIDPLVLQQSLAQKGHANLKVFNFGINGATAQVVNWLLQDLLPADHLPRLIVWGDGARAFNEGRIDHTYNNIVASQGHRLLTSGVRPQLPSFQRFDLGQLCMNTWMPLLSSPFVALKSLDQPVAQIPSKNLFCQQPLKALIQQALVATLQPLKAQLTPEALGFRVVHTQFTPSSYFQRFPRVPGRFDADYRNFRLAGKQFEAFQSVVQFANRRQIPLVFVNLPLTDLYLDPTRRLYEQQFESRMQGLERSQDWIFINLMNQQDLKQNRYFEDPSHINRYGAAAIASFISKDLLSPLSVTYSTGNR